MRAKTIDLNFMGTEEVIASFLLLGTGSAGIVETGPTSCLERLQTARRSRLDDGRRARAQQEKGGYYLLRPHEIQVDGLYPHPRPLPPASSARRL